MEHKIFEIDEYKKVDEEGKTYLEGYANTKNKEDSYGDIPKGDNVYNLARMKQNPIALVDHKNSAANIAGNFVILEEDKKGLRFKLLLRNLDDVFNPEVKDAISAYQTGFGRALSIGGKWIYGDAKNPKIITEAVVHEISLVAIGADDRALSHNIDKPKSLNSEAIPTGIKTLEDLIADYRLNLSPEVLQKIIDKTKEK
jgi:HK97 family phage prohead protease